MAEQVQLKSVQLAELRAVRGLSQESSSISAQARSALVLSTCHRQLANVGCFGMGSSAFANHTAKLQL